MLDLHSQPILICFLMYKRSKVRRHLGPESVREFSICDLTEILHAYTQTTPRACSKVFKNSFVFASCSSCGSGKEPAKLCFVTALGFFPRPAPSWPYCILSLMTQNLTATGLALGPAARP